MFSRASFPEMGTQNTTCFSSTSFSQDISSEHHQRRASNTSTAGSPVLGAESVTPSFGWLSHPVHNTAHAPSHGKVHGKVDGNGLYHATGQPLSHDSKIPGHDHGALDMSSSGDTDGTRRGMRQASVHTAMNPHHQVRVQMDNTWWTDLEGGGEGEDPWYAVLCNVVCLNTIAKPAPHATIARKPPIATTPVVVLSLL